MSFGYDAAGHVRYAPTALVSVAFGLVGSVHTAGGILQYEVKDLLAVVVPIAGTIVALALPASQLAQSTLQDVLSDVSELIKKFPLAEIATYLDEKRTRGRRDLGAIRCVVIYSVISLFLGGAGLFVAANALDLLPAWPLRDALASCATGFLAASVLWLVPVVRSGFDFGPAEGLVDKLLAELHRQQAAAAGAVAPAASKPAAPIAPAAPGA